MKRIFIFIFFFLILSLSAKSTSIDVAEGTDKVFNEYMNEISPYKNLPLNKLLIKTAEFFIGKPYIASSLDKNENEKLIVNLTGFDCTTFVENCMALSLMLKSDTIPFSEINGGIQDMEDTPFNRYCLYLQKIRYRGGVIDGYSSRLHYMTDWSYDNQQKGLLEDITIALGGRQVDKKIDYMSTHPNSYKQLKNNPRNLQEIRNVEKLINTRENYIIILKRDISAVKNDLNDGDIVIFATTIGGLDYTHVGIVCKNNDSLTFIHASTKTMKVNVEQQTLINYCLNSRLCSGITLLRLTQI